MGNDCERLQNAIGWAGSFGSKRQVADASWAVDPVRSANRVIHSNRSMLSHPWTLNTFMFAQKNSTWFADYEALGPAWSLAAQWLKCAAQRRLNELCAGLRRVHHAVLQSKSDSSEIGIEWNATLDFGNKSDDLYAVSVVFVRLSQKRGMSISHCYRDAPQRCKSFVNRWQAHLQFQR